ncbi:Gag polyprotein [Willisornis vidua]|uniref:Gag polyprotein n=1 Tax=Willisornis vidua TaxID=1566151 RepID=A0ABQ9D070_9PASS|nr:Gag polyprotein [Willisornis vidua]
MILTCALMRPVPGWQGVWKDLGRFLGQLSTPITWDFTPEQVFNPSKLTHHLIEGCLAQPSENQQILALYWGLACAYRATVQYSQRTVVEAGTQTASEDTVVETGTQTTTVVTVPVTEKKRETRKTTGPYCQLEREEEEEKEEEEEEEDEKEEESSGKEGSDQEASPSTHKLEKGVREFKQETEITRSLTSSELRDLGKDYSRHPGERISAWLLRCWDYGADGQLLEGREAQQLGSLARDRGIERGIGKETAVYSLWRRLLSSVRTRYPFKEDLVNSPGKWTTAHEGIQYLRELAVLEVIYGDLKNDNVSKDPEDVPCTMAMWRKVIQSAPASYSNSLAAMYYPEMDTPTVERASFWLQNLEETLCTSSSLQASTSAAKGSPRNQSSPALIRGKESLGQMTRGGLWFFLCDHGEDMRKWDGEPTFKLEARVRELKEKRVVKKGPLKKAVN